MKNITLSADEHLIEAARQRAREEHTTLNEAFQAWLAEYARTDDRMRKFDATMDALQGKLRVGRKLTRDEMNAR